MEMSVEGVLVLLLLFGGRVDGADVFEIVEDHSLVLKPRGHRRDVKRLVMALMRSMSMLMHIFVVVISCVLLRDSFGTVAAINGIAEARRVGSHVGDIVVASLLSMRRVGLLAM